MKFWDSSAMTPLLMREAATPTIRDLFTEDHEIVAWWGTLVECASAIARVERERSATMTTARVLLGDIWKAVLQVEPTERVRASALRLLTVHTLRAGDALQLAAALTWREADARDAEFVCLDERLRAAARAEGFRPLPM